MSNFLAGIETIIKRMETNPEEFFNEADKWRFIFKDKFREVLTEAEKGAMHEGLKAVRRKEFDYNVMQTLLKDEVQGQMKEYRYAPAMTLDSSGNLGLGTTISANGTYGFGQAQPKQDASARSLGLFK